MDKRLYQQCPTLPDPTGSRQRLPATMFVCYFPYVNTGDDCQLSHAAPADLQLFERYAEDLIQDLEKGQSHIG